MNNIYKDYCYEVFDIETKKENINNDKYKPLLLNYAILMGYITYSMSKQMNSDWEDAIRYGKDLKDYGSYKITKPF